MLPSEQRLEQRFDRASSTDFRSSVLSRGITATTATTLSTPRKLRVAVCLAGQVRTLVHPAIYSFARANLLSWGQHDLFLVL